MRPSPSGTTPAAEASRPAVETAPTPITAVAESRGATDALGLSLPLDPMSPGGVDPVAQATIAANALMERTPFTIDNPGDDDDVDDDDVDDDESDESGETGYESEDDVLDEVRLFFCRCFAETHFD